jgi:elongation factor 1-beta
MADVVITMKIMPESPDVDLNGIKEKADHLIKEFGGELGKSEEQPVAFGLKSLILYFVMNEELGSTEELEEKVSGVEGVQSVEVTDVRRAVG